MEDKLIDAMLDLVKRMRFSDVEWLKEMIDHHEAAIKMSKMAIDKATHDELKKLAENIIEAQSAEITKMKEWVREWTM